jgi:hypothetical protein
LFAIEVRKVFYHLVDNQPTEYRKFLLIDKKNGHLRNEKSFTARMTILNRYLVLIKNEELILDDLGFLISGKKM